MKPKIFITCYLDQPEWWVGSALAEDGTGLAQHVSSNKIWVRHDMGLTSKWKHEAYAAHYPDGYELIDLCDSTNDQLHDNAEYWAALTLNHKAFDEQLELGG